MSASTGNTYAKGNKGGGRKSAYTEKADAQFCLDLWNGRIRKQKLQKKIALGKQGAKDLFALKILDGNERLLSKLFDKLYPTIYSDDEKEGLEIKGARELADMLQKILEEGDGIVEEVSKLP